MEIGPQDRFDTHQDGDSQGSDWEDNGLPERRREPQPDPTPQYVYWIRRAVALLIVIAVIALIVLGIKGIAGLFSKDDSSSDKATTGAASSEKDKKSETKAGATTEPAQSNEDSGDSPKTCDPAAVSIALSSARATVGAGASLALNLNVKNEGEDSCILDVSPTHTTVTIYSGKDRIWSNEDCDEAGTQALFMEAKAETNTTVEWNGKRSDSKCTANLPAVKSGTYRAIAQYDDLKSKEFVFSVQ